MSTPKKSPAAKSGSNVKTEVKTADAGTAPKTERKPKAKPLPLAQRFELMQFVKEADASMPDSTLASTASEKFGRTISPATITEYRKQFGLASVKKPTAGQLATYIDLLKVQIVGLGATPVPFPAFVEEAGEAAGEASGESASSADASTAGGAVEQPSEAIAA